MKIKQKKKREYDEILRSTKKYMLGKKHDL